MTELIITEKPQAALKIATALADDKPVKKTKGNAVYYEITRNGNTIYVGCAVGHLYGLAEKKKTKWGTYPVFDVEWKPKYELDKSSAYTKQYITLLKQISKGVEKVTIATDYDLEGSVIGHNIVTELLHKKDARRMKFSTLTKDELEASYENASKHLDFNIINAGETRHYLDWFYGINLTNALSMSIKTASNRFKVLSSGRVQSPTLKLIVDREKEIKKFKPTTYWEIFLEGLIHKDKIKAQHKADKIKEKSKVTEILKNTKGKKAIVSLVKETTQNQSPPIPFDLTTLQVESFRHLRIAPKQTSQYAQELYIDGLISYPRTSSQKLPATIGYEKVLKALAKNKEYTKYCNSLLEHKKLKPIEGKKSDPAHPAIYPTGEKAKLAGKKSDLYDLIVRRFLAAFGSPAKRKTMSGEIDVNKEIFLFSGTKTVEPGWHVLYGKYAKFKEEEIPLMKEGEEIKTPKIYDEEKETQPPKRYTQASIIKTMEKHGLGTKATRALIVDTLYDRAYIQNQPLEATELGIAIVDALDKYSPEILDEKLTSSFEKEMDKVQEGKKKKEEVIEKSKEVLKKILKHFKSNEIKIGEDLATATLETQKQMNELGICPVCKKGKIRILYSKKTKKRFAACDAYPNCKTTYSLPQQGLLKSTDVCKHDGFPQVIVIRKGKRPWTLCFNPNCPGKENWNNNKSITE